MLKQGRALGSSPTHRAFRSGPAPRLARSSCTSRSTSARQAQGAASGQQHHVDQEHEQQQQLLNRRQALASQLLLVAGALAPVAQAATELTEEAKVAPGQVATLSDPILAYRFNYPTSTAAGRPLRMITSRPPEKYSSAPPLTADARQRIVSEVFDFRSYVTASMTVGPASGVLKGRAPSEWTPKEVSLTVLIDRSTARTTAGQRVSLNDVQEAHAETREGGAKYWVYEHISQGSPTITARGRESYRHALAVTSARPGLDGTQYLYTLNLSCPEDLWSELQPVFADCVASFTLLPTTRDYIPPDKDPWLFF